MKLPVSFKCSIKRQLIFLYLISTGFLLSCNQSMNGIAPATSPYGLSDNFESTASEYIIWKWGDFMSADCCPTYYVMGRKASVTNLNTIEPGSVKVLSGKNHLVFSPVMERLSTGELLVAWIEQSNVRGERNVVCRFFDQDLQPVSDELLLNEVGSVVSGSTLDIHFIANDDVVLTWSARNREGEGILALRVVNADDHSIGISRVMNNWGDISKPKISNSGMGYSISFIDSHNRPMLAFFNRFHSYQSSLDVASDIVSAGGFMNIEMEFDHSMNKYLAFFSSADRRIYYRWVGNSGDLGECMEVDEPHFSELNNTKPFNLAVQQNYTSARYMLVYHVDEALRGGELYQDLYSFTLERRIDRTLTDGCVERISSGRDSVSVISSNVFPSSNAFVVLVSEAKIKPGGVDEVRSAMIYRLTKE